MIYGSLNDSLNSFAPGKTDAWGISHDFGHAMNEGVHSLFVKHAVSPELDKYSHSIGKCLHNLTPDKVKEGPEPTIADLVAEAAEIRQQDGEIEQISRVFAQITEKACEITGVLEGSPADFL